MSFCGLPYCSFGHFYKSNRKLRKFSRVPQLVLWFVFFRPPDKEQLYGRDNAGSNHWTGLNFVVLLMKQNRGWCLCVSRKADM